MLAVFTLIVTSASPLAAQAGATAIVTDPDGVNLRGGPGTHYASLAIVPRGTELPILGAKVNDDWLPVSYQGRLGFIYDEFVDVRPGPGGAGPVQPGAIGTPAGVQPASLPMPASPSPSASPQPGGTPAPASMQMRVNSPDGVNLRAGPGLDQRILAVIPNNTRLTVLGRSADGRWSQVTHNGQTGWVDGQFLSPADEQRPVEGPPGRFIWPVSGRSVTTGFSGGHPGVDIDQFPAGGNPVVATAAGKVTFAGGNPCCSYGLYIEIEHKDGSSSLYAHLASVDVREGQEVTQGQSLGRSGSTGRSTGAHLHFEIHLNGGPVDPMGQLPRGQ